MNSIINEYNNLIASVDTHGGLFGYTLRHDLSMGFPIISNKIVNFDNVVSELKWYLRGSVDVNVLWKFGNHTWDDILYNRYKTWTLTNNHLGLNLFTKEEFIDTIKQVQDFSDGWAHPGPMYGKQWRDFNGVDQLKELISDIKSNSNKIMYISSWNTNELQFMAFNPNHNGFQIHKNNNELSLSISILRCDVTYELPHLVSLYSLFLEVLSKELSMKPRNLVVTLGECYSAAAAETDYIDEFPKIKISSTDILNGDFNTKFF